MTKTYEDDYKQGVEMATEYLRAVADCFLTRDDVPASVAEVPAFLARIAENIDDNRRIFAAVAREIAASDTMADEPLWLCRCDCGREATVSQEDLLSGKATSGPPSTKYWRAAR